MQAGLVWAFVSPLLAMIFVYGVVVLVAIRSARPKDVKAIFKASIEGFVELTSRLPLVGRLRGNVRKRSDEVSGTGDDASEQQPRPDAAGEEG